MESNIAFSCLLNYATTRGTPQVIEGVFIYMNPATNSQQALANLQSFQSGMKKPEDILTSQEQSLGIPQASTQVQGLRGAIQNTTNLLGQVAPSVYGRTQNSLVTNAQASRNIQNEQAPIAQTLDRQNTDYSNQESDLQNLLGRAGTLSSLQAQGQDSQLGYLKDIYSALYGQEQDSAKMAEAKREFDTQQATSRASAGGGGSSIILGGMGSNTAPNASSATYGLKTAGSPNGGYYFRSSSGAPISALQYSQLTGTPFNQLLQKMADSGDTYAKSVLKFATPTGFSGNSSSAVTKFFTG